MARKDDDKPRTLVENALAEGLADIRDGKYEDAATVLRFAQEIQEAAKKNAPRDDREQ